MPFFENEKINPFLFLRKKSIESFILRCISFILLFLMHAVLARHLGPLEYGIFSFVLSITFVLSIFAGLGWPVAAIRFISEYNEKKRWALIIGVMIQGHFIVFAASLVLIGAIGIAVKTQIIPTGLSQNFIYVSILLPIFSLSELRNKMFLGLKCIFESIIFNDILLPLSLTAFVWIGLVKNAQDLIGAYFFLSLILLLLGGGYLWRNIPIECKNIKPEFQTADWTRIALPLVLAGLGQIVLNRTSILMLGLFCDMKAVGIYSIANRIALLNTFILTSVNAIAAPMLSSAYYGHDIDRFFNIFCKTMKWSGLGALCPFIIMICFPGFLLSFFGNNFIGSTLILQVLAVGHFYNAATGLVGSALSMTGRQNIFGKVTVIISILNATVSYWGIQKWEALGAAIIYSSSVIAFNTILLIIVIREFKIKREFNAN